MKITLDIVYAIKDVVYLKTDEEQKPRLVIGFTVRPNNLIVYDLQNGEKVSSHYDFEISEEKDVLMLTTN